MIYGHTGGSNRNLPKIELSDFDKKHQDIKKSYAHVSFVNLGLDYDYTICPWNDLAETVQIIKMDAEDLDEDGFNSWNDKLQLPSITVQVTMMTDLEYSVWFAENVESRA
jgi:hypothetical protein